MSKLFFDVETSALPLDKLGKLMPEFEPAGNLKDPDKIKASIESRRVAWLESCALRAITGQIIAVTIAVDDEEPMMVTGSESELINWAIASFETQFSTGGMIYSWGGSTFDLPFIMQRAAVHKIPAFSQLGGFFRGKYYLKPNFVDARSVWSMYSPDYRDTSLGTVALALGVGEKTGSGDGFALLLLSDPAKAKDYAVNDVVLLRNIVQVMWNG